MTMLYFFNNGILLLLFDSLRTAPPRLSIKLATVANAGLWSQSPSSILIGWSRSQKLLDGGAEAEA